MHTGIDIAISLAALTVLEVVLGIDNLVFILIASDKLPAKERRYARQLGLTLAWMGRLLLLASATWVGQLTIPWITILNHVFSGRDIFLLLGGIFLLGKATQEMHLAIEPKREHMQRRPLPNQLFKTIVQIVLLDAVFSLDSVLTAIALTTRFWLMAIAISIAVIAMLFASDMLSRFIRRHPTVKILALSFLILIGMMLIADGFQCHIPRGYIYFAMGFAIFIELLSIRYDSAKRRAS